MTGASRDMELYFGKIEQQLLEAYTLAVEARKKGYDPEEFVDVRLARDMAERVEGLISSVAPQLLGSGMTKRIRELEKTYGNLDWRVALVIAEEVAMEKFCKFKDKKEAMEVGIRTGFAYHTVGIVSAPLEGFIELNIKKRKDGREYFAAKYSGPVRGAGGTGASVSVIIADYVRTKMGYAPYDPQDDEISRYSTELTDYHERITNLQYNPSDDEIKFLVKNIPIEIDGDPTENIEVSNHKDMQRVNTNLIRGGVCLVVSMIALKAPKLWKELSKWGKDFGLDWTFLEKFLEIQKKKKAKKSEGEESKQKISPDYTFISDLVAGRPVLTYPLRDGGFRLRYGRTRTSGFSAASIHPATMIVLNKYIAIGTQLKMERPGKAAAITVCDSIDGPIVKLNNGNVIKLETELKAKQYNDSVTEILYLGDILISYGDFFDRAHSLIPAGYCEEWWVQDFEKAVVDSFGNLDMEKLSDFLEMPVSVLHNILKKPNEITFEQALRVSEKLNIPLHPKFTYYFKSITSDDFLELTNWIKKSNIKRNEDGINKIIMPYKQGAKCKRTLEIMGIPHIVSANEFVIIEDDDAKALMFFTSAEKNANETEENNTLSLINNSLKIKIMDKAGTFIGARMGRPEKAKMRMLTGSPHVLFPVGEEGGRLRCFQSALEAGKVKADFAIYFCEKCQKQTIYSVCEVCGNKTSKMFFCRNCGVVRMECIHNPLGYTNMLLDINYYFSTSLKKLGIRNYPDLIKGVRGTSNQTHVPENLAKGILRAKHKIYVNKDGTTRYDMTELPITHFKPSEIKTPIEKMLELGYSQDIHGKLLESENQILELKPQDIILPLSQESFDESSDEVLFRTANFIDELLKNFYNLPSFYNLKEKKDIIGHLVIGLAPHISSGSIGRVIGFSEARGCYAHPLWHASLRRDCDGDENCVILLLDAFLNFSRQYLPNKRGARTMDAPLVLTSRLNPAEVDDMVHRLDIAWMYPLEFYNACLEYKNPWDVKIELLGKRLGTEKQYESMGFTHSVSDINAGVHCSDYKTLPSMEEKLKGQMILAERIRAVDEADVAKLVIEKHFLKDIRGNLRKFSTQQFRCVKCNTKYRRPPLVGRCTKCSGNIIFTVSEGSIVKYLEPSISLAKKYNVPEYVKQSLELTRMRIESVFGREKEKQEGLGKWFG